MKKKDNSKQTKSTDPKLTEKSIEKLIDVELKSTDADTLKLIHQLEVHQMELEMINEELKRAQTIAQNTAEKYTELFDFAPSGYFLLTSDGIISEINLFAADMLGKERMHLINRRFVFFVANESKLIFNQFLRSIFEEKREQDCEITLTNNYKEHQYVQLAGKISQNEELCLVTMVDITELKKISEINETLLTSLPYPAMYIKYPDRVIVAANNIALNMGAKVGGQCWREFGRSEYITQEQKKIAAKYPNIVPPELDIKCSFCLADNCFMHHAEQQNPEIHAFGLIWNVYWLKASKDIFLHYAVDVTELKKTEAALKENELKLRTVVEYTVDWVFWIDLNDTFIYCSPSCEKITGYKATDFIENPKLLFEIIFPEDLNTYHHHKQKEETNKQTNLEIQFRIIRKDGNIRWIGHLCKSVYDDEGIFIGIRGSNRDITERKEMEIQLFNSEQRYKQLSENINDGVFMCKNGILKYTNQSLNNIFGYDDTELQGMKIVELALPEFKDELSRIVGLKASINQTRKMDLNCYKKDGSILNVEMNLNYVASNKEIYGVVLDITEKKKIHNRNIVKAIIMTEEKEKTNFSKELHDGLGPLLSTINLYLQGLLRPKSSELQQEIITKAQHVLEEALISLAEISNKMSPHLLTEYGLTSAIQGFIGKFERTSDINIIFNSNLERRFEMEIEAALYRVIIECINNTIKYAKAKTIQIEIKDSENNVYINYRDDGIGFDLAKIIKDQKGLGLNNIENRINGIGGDVKMYSNPGRGVYFQIHVNA